MLRALNGVVRNLMESRAYPAYQAYQAYSLYEAGAAETNHFPRSLADLTGLPE